MSDENLINEIGGAGASVGEVGNSSPFDDFLLIDDDGNPIDRNPQKGNEPESKNQTDPGKKPAEDPNNGDGKQKPAPTAGFESRFFKPNEKGENQFDAEGAYNFFAPKKDSKLAFKYEMNVPPQDPNAKPKEPEKPENPYLKRKKEEYEYVQKLKSQTFFWHDKFQEGLNKGFDANQAVLYANNSTQEHIDNTYAEWMMKRDEEDAENRFKNETSAEENRRIEIQSRTNIASIASELGGEEAFQQFMIGYKGQDGKWVRGVATDAIELLFDRENPDLKSMNSGELQKVMNNWWNKFTSKMSNLQFLVDYGLGKLVRNNLDKMIAHGKKVDLETQRQQRIGQTRSSSGINRGSQNQESMDLLNNFMSNDRIATV